MMRQLSYFFFVLIWQMDHHNNGYNVTKMLCFAWPSLENNTTKVDSAAGPVATDVLICSELEHRNPCYIVSISTA